MPCRPISMLGSSFWAEETPRCAPCSQSVSAEASAPACQRCYSVSPHPTSSDPCAGTRGRCAHTQCCRSRTGWCSSAALLSAAPAWPFRPQPPSSTRAPPASFWAPTMQRASARCAWALLVPAWRVCRLSWRPCCAENTPVCVLARWRPVQRDERLQQPLDPALHLFSHSRRHLLAAPCGLRVAGELLLPQRPACFQASRQGLSGARCRLRPVRTAGQTPASARCCQAGRPTRSFSGPPSCVRSILHSSLSSCPFCVSQRLTRSLLAVLLRVCSAGRRLCDRGPGAGRVRTCDHGRVRSAACLRRLRPLLCPCSSLER